MVKLSTVPVLGDNVNNLETIRILLRQVSTYIRQTREAKAKIELHDANRFNPFRFMETSENGLSAVLAFLLDPQETHGQRDLFLNSFLKMLGKHDFLAYDHVRVITEQTTFNGRRHDIFLEGRLGGKTQWVISIENKLCGAADQNNQIRDYWKDLEKYSSNGFIMYLTPDDVSPKEGSIDKTSWEGLIKEKKASVVTLYGLISWLEQVPIVAPRIQIFVAEFCKFLMEDVMNQTAIDDNLIKILIQDNDNINSALAIIHQANELYIVLLFKLIEQLKEKCKKYNKLIEIRYEFTNQISIDDINSKWFGIYFLSPKKYGVAIEFARSLFRGCFYGVYTSNIENNNVELNKLNFGKGFNKSNYWAAQKSFSGIYKNWKLETWLQVNTGELADVIFEQWDPLLNMLCEYEENTTKPSWVS